MIWTPTWIPDIVRFGRLKIMTSSERQKAALQLRETIFSKVKDDWTFEAHSSAANHGAYPLIIGLPKEAAQPVESFTHWKERYNSPSSSESESPASARTSFLDSLRTPSRRKVAYNDPDSVGLAVKLQKRERRLLKRQALEEEMSWNQGLDHWQQQRDAWTGGRIRRLPDDDGLIAVYGSEFEDSHSFNPSIVVEGGASSASASTMVQPFAYDVVEEVPVAPPLIPPTSIRSHITSSTHPAIYSKVVVRSLTPTVPLNLKDVTAALVAGWKTDGQWPPKSNTPEPMPARRRQRRLEGEIEGTDPDPTRHHRINRGVGVVKKVFGIGNSNSET
ncbi:MAG: hypothetical protein M1814_002667 [Vezdaea aestivalis]|nr:MAG: hypothetical protein M1814_002667 [Vezdaea aestivalis]